jgi:hypothetical protein
MSGDAFRDTLERIFRFFLQADQVWFGLGAHTMTEDEKIRGIIENAIESAFVKFPDVGDGTTWPHIYKDRAECVTLTTAVLQALEKSGYKIVPLSS